MKSVAAFYARFGTKFGVVDLAHPNGHRGLDVRAESQDDIPALRAGTVRLIHQSKILGRCMVIQVAPNDFDGYAHTVPLPSLRVNDVVAQGARIGQIAGSRDQPGSAWSGPHLHLTNSVAERGIFAGAVRDPLPVIAAASSETSLAAVAKRKEDEMYLTWNTRGTGYLVTSAGTLGLPSAQLYVLFYRLINSNQQNSPFANGAKPEEFNDVEIAMMNDLLHVLSFATTSFASIDPVELARAISKELPGNLTVNAPLPQEILDRLGEISNGDREFRAEDFTTNDDIDIDTLAAAVHAAVPKVARDALAAAGGRAPNR